MSFELIIIAVTVSTFAITVIHTFVLSVERAITEEK